MNYRGYEIELSEAEVVGFNGTDKNYIINAGAGKLLFVASAAGVGSAFGLDTEQVLSDIHAMIDAKVSRSEERP